MKFLYGKQDLRTMDRGNEHCFMLTNGLGGYVSTTAAFSIPRCDQGLLVAAVKAPNERITMVHRLSEKLTVGDREFALSTQSFGDDSAEEDGYRHLSVFSYEYIPTWTYHIWGVTVQRRCAMDWGKNTSAVLYRIENLSGEVCKLDVTPFLKFAPKEQALEEEKTFTYSAGAITSGDYTMYIRTNGKTEGMKANLWQTLAYPEDAKDGRPEEGKTGACCHTYITVLPGETAQLELELIFSMEQESVSGEQMLADYVARAKQLEESCGMTDEIARQLAISADAYIAHRDSTNGKTILAGYPLFSDWGRDTMIALPGCCLATGRYEDAKSILRTFFAYEKDGLVPNLFPEGQAKPMYNTVDAALLLVDCVWQYVERTGDLDFVQEAWPVMESIVSHYQTGTHHSIGMDEDGLIHAGGGLDQVTWMDVCVNGILPTPRHGKPVEVNAYWYNALKIMENFAARLGKDGASYGALAEKVKASFVSGFYMEDKGYLKDVISGTSADEQLRCNQIWAVSMPFTMLDEQQEKSIVDTVFYHHVSELMF